jgi:hypothetical protein
MEKFFLLVSLAKCVFENNNNTHTHTHKTKHTKQEKRNIKGIEIENGFELGH